MSDSQHKQRRASLEQAQQPLEMTPMIDVVFLLIIFFVLITDLTQREFEQLELPVSARAEPIEASESRAILNVLFDGSVVRQGRTLLGPAASEAPGVEGDSGGKQRYAEVGAELELARRHHADLGQADAPDLSLLLLADEVTPFSVLQAVMAEAARDGVQIEHMEFGARPAADATDSGPSSTPRDAGSAGRAADARPAGLPR